VHPSLLLYLIVSVIPDNFPTVGLENIIKVSFSGEFTGERMLRMVLMLAVHKANIRCIIYIYKIINKYEIIFSTSFEK